MDNVLNRPLFRHREARNRLNDIAGVQRFEVGGPVQGFQPGGEVRPEGLPSMLEIIQMGSLGRTTPMVGSVMSAPKEGENAAGVMAALNERLQDPNLRDNERRAVEKQRAALEFAINAGYGAADAVTDAAALLNYLGTRAIEYGVAPVVSVVAPSLGESIYDQIPMFDAGTEELARMGQAVPSNLRPSDTPKNVAFEAAGRGTPPLRPAASGMEAEARESRPRGGLLPTPGPTPESAFKGPSGMEQEARGRGPMTPALGPSGMEQEARDRGPMITNPAEVAAGLNAEDPAVRQKTVADFMQEYAAAAPEYKGMDKNLLLAQIGFAIAAGESPNAMQNIANGLLAGSDAMLKDKAAKDEFDRQVQLAAMQYGFGEVARDRELERSATNYIAARDIVYRGRKFPKGTAVPVLNSDIINNRLPEGLLDTAFADTLATKEAAVLDSLQKQYEQNIIDDTELRANSDAYSALVDEAARLQRGDDYFRTGLMILGREGEATGGPGTLKKFVYQMASAAGIDPKDLDSYISDPAELEKVLTRGANAAFRNYLGDEAGNSISNMDVTRNVRAIVSGVTAEGSFEALFKNEDAVIRDIQDALAENEGQRARNLGQMAAIEQRLAGRYTKAGSLANPQPALDVLAPLRESAGIVSTQNPSPGDIVVDENGVWTLYIPEN